MNTRADYDLLVAGQGLAGTALAVSARLAGLSVCLADPDPLPGRTASRVAAGLITPLTGKKINPGWRLEELLPLALDFYARAGDWLGARFFHSEQVHRWFTDAEEARSFGVRIAEPRIHRWCAGQLPPEPRLNVPAGGFAMAGGGWLDVPLWLDSVRRRFRDDGQWIESAVDEADIEVGPDAVRWHGLTARRVVFCHGLAAGRSSRFFPGLPFRPASGEVLEVVLANGSPPVVWNSGGKWLAPRRDGTCLCGATYGFGAWEGVPTIAGRVELSRFLDGILREGYEIIGHRAGVRPILQQSRPVAGFLPDCPVVGLLNGLGSKGVLTAPWAAGALVAAIQTGATPDPELDPARLHRHPAITRP